MTVTLIVLAVVLGLWIARLYRRGMTKRLDGSRPWLTVSVWAVGLGSVVVLAVTFGFLLDYSSSP